MQEIDIMRHSDHTPQIILKLPADQYEALSAALDTVAAEGVQAAPVQIYAEGNDDECYSLITTGGHWRSFEEFARTLTWVDDDDDDDEPEMADAPWSASPTPPPVTSHPGDRNPRLEPRRNI